MKKSKSEELVRLGNILYADLAKPTMEDGLDISLFTLKECEEIERAQAKHDLVFERRAVELRFYPEILTKKEQVAILRCMSYDELLPYYRIVAIEEKIYRLMTLQTMIKIEIRKYTRMVRQFAENNFDQETYSDKNIVELTENYFKIMSQNEEKVYEDRYYFLNEERREKVLRFLDNFVPEKRSWGSTANLVLDKNDSGLPVLVE